MSPARRFALLPPLALGLVAGLPSIAAAADPLGPGASRVNAFVFGNATISNNDSDGPLAVGGDAAFLGAFQANSLELGTSFGTPTMNNVGLLVKGNLAAPGNPGDLKIKGNAYVAGAITGGAIQYQSGALFTGAAVDTGIFATQKAFSLGQSLAIRSMTGTSAVTGAGNTWTLDLSTVPTTFVGTAAVKRVTLDAAVINANPLATLGISGQDSSTTLLIDVTGGGTLNWSWTVNGAVKNHLLWNANDLLAVNVNDRDWTGSLLAPKAAVTLNNGNFNGSLVADRLVVNNGKELHWGAGTMFDGAAPVPEPASFAALGLGLAALARRRRR